MREGWVEIAGSVVMCVMQDLYPLQLCVRDIDRGSVGHAMREHVSCGKLEVIEYLDAKCSVRVERRMLKNPY